MIYTITLNPAIDYVMHVSDYESGRVNRSVGEELYAGGKGINVSCVLKNLGKDSMALGFSAGDSGDILEKLLQKTGIKFDFIRLKEGRTRINVKLSGAKKTEINAVGPEISDAELDKLYEKLDKTQNGDFVVLSGSIARGISKTVYADIMRKYAPRGVRFAVDTEGEALLDVLKYSPFLIKPNIDELGALFSRKIKDTDELIECAEKLRDMGAQNVLVSMGADGAALFLPDGRRIIKAAPKGKVKNPTGAGDSMVAGFIAGYLEKERIEYAFDLGLAAGSATAFSDGLAAGKMIRMMNNEE